MSCACLRRCDPPAPRTLAGALTGAVASNWGDIKVPSAWPALVRTGSQMAQYGTTLALVGGTFATVDVSSRLLCSERLPLNLRCAGCQGCRRSGR